MPRRARSRRPPPNLIGLWLEAGGVIGLRLTQLATQSAPKQEAERMVREKPAAFASAALSASTAATRSALLRPFDPLAAGQAAVGAWTRSLTTKVRRNRRRLDKVKLGNAKR